MTSARAKLPVVLALTSLACGGPPLKRAPLAEVPIEHAPEPPEPSPLERRAEIRFEARGLAPVPMVHGKIGGEPTWMQVDSGASTHLVAGWLARRGGILSEGSGASLRDYASVGQVAQRADSRLVMIDRWGRLRPGPLYVVEQDEKNPSGRAGVGALISPQLIDLDHPVIFDLAQRELRSGTPDDAARALAFRRVEITSKTRACGGLYVASVTIDGRPTTLVVDTGAAVTNVLAGTRAAAALAGRSVDRGKRSYTVSRELAVRDVPAARVAIGDFAVTTDVAITPAPSEFAGCGVEGLLGVDVLRACVLVFGLPRPGALRISCG